VYGISELFASWQVKIIFAIVSCLLFYIVRCKASFMCVVASGFTDSGILGLQREVRTLSVLASLRAVLWESASGDGSAVLPEQSVTEIGVNLTC